MFILFWTQKSSLSRSRCFGAKKRKKKSSLLCSHYSWDNKVNSCVDTVLGLKNGSVLCSHCS